MTARRNGRPFRALLTAVEARRNEIVVLVLLQELFTFCFQMARGRGRALDHDHRMQSMVAVSQSSLVL